MSCGAAAHGIKSIPDHQIPVQFRLQLTVGDSRLLGNALHIRVTAAVQGKMTEKTKQIGISAGGRKRDRGVFPSSGGMSGFLAGSIDDRGRLPKKFHSRPVVHGESGLVHRIFLKYSIVEQKVRAMEADVVEAAVGADNILNILGQALVDASPETIVRVSSRHLMSSLRLIQ